MAKSYLHSIILCLPSARGKQVFRLQVYSCRSSDTTECLWQTGFVWGYYTLVDALIIPRPRCKVVRKDEKKMILGYFGVKKGVIGGHRGVQKWEGLRICNQLRNGHSTVYYTTIFNKMLILGNFGGQKWVIGSLGGSKSEKVWKYVFSSQTGIQQYITRLYLKKVDFRPKNHQLFTNLINYSWPTYNLV